LPKYGFGSNHDDPGPLLVFDRYNWDYYVGSRLGWARLSIGIES